MSTYTPEQLKKRDESKWTLVQAILAPIQFLAFVISFILVVRYLATGQGYVIANISVLIKITLLWLITITGMIWEKEVFGHWFLAPEFFWEDVGNAVAMIMHNLYFVARWQNWTPEATMTLMLVAYIAYLFNMAQFIVKGVRARKERTGGAMQAQQSG
jgi:3-vinyl bacteriochlorophyllide hydratase